MHVERFAPSPTGPLHLGHAYSALTAWQRARANGGTFLLRIEDIDRTRARPEWEAQIYDDLNWLGISWPEPVMRQSDRLPVYRKALQTLWDCGLLFECTCTRRDIEAAIAAPHEGEPVFGPDGVIYPGTCRPPPRTQRTLPDRTALRLNMTRAIATLPGTPLSFFETGAGPCGDTGEIRVPPDTLEQTCGDIILARRNMGTSYHLSVVLDDAAQNVTHVARGQDLFEATKIHVLLQNLLDLPTPIYHHHRLIRDETGKRLAKRDDARAIAKYRADGASPDDIRTMIGL